ncbi:hypothetical protein sos41_35910 [Alphaproteobacteria bacterium SO-S41]|nr:hypothetical protein sos41_35910 [Alphaproteobacteria bacterium SO-S41]
MSGPVIPISSHRLDAGSIVATLERLQARIGERFPAASLVGVCGELVATGRDTARSVRQLARPVLWLRAVAGIIVALWLGGTGLVLSEINWVEIGRRADATSLAQGLDSTVNLLLLAGAAIWFLLTLEQRWKRSRTLSALYRLRSFAHVIDMHQLTKDPTAILGKGQPTASSPERRMTEFELARYLEYCAEMLALTAKLAALYAAETNDDQVMGAVNDVEDLASNLGRKIWQKIMIISQLDEGRASTQPTGIALPSAPG